MSETAILGVARTVMSAALPLAVDWSDDPADPKVDKKDAFVVTVTRDGATAAAMGSPLEEVQLTVQVEIFGHFKPSEDGKAIMGAKAETARAALVNAPALLAMTDVIRSSSFDIELAPGDVRLARATLGLSVQATF